MALGRLVTRISSQSYPLLLFHQREDVNENMSNVIIGIDNRKICSGGAQLPPSRQVACAACPPFTESRNNGSECYACEPGFYYSSDAEVQHFHSLSFPPFSITHFSLPRFIIYPISSARASSSHSLILNVFSRRPFSSLSSIISLLRIFHSQ